MSKRLGLYTRDTYALVYMLQMLVHGSAILLLKRWW